jgi:hypothetical protein
MPNQKQTSNQCSLQQRKLSSTYMAEVEHVLSEVLNIEMNHNLKLSETLSITIREITWAHSDPIQSRRPQVLCFVKSR